MSRTEGKDREAPLMDRLNDAIRENPLAAGLIGAGLVWMLFGTKGFGAVGGLASSAASKVAETARSAGSATTDAAGAVLEVGAKAASTARKATAGVVDHVASIVPDLPTADTEAATNGLASTQSAAGDRLKSMASSGREYSAAIQSRLSESLEKQPLLLGAIGLAIGAGIASTFAATSLESEWLGEKAAAARDTLKTVAADAKEHVGKVVSAVEDEAQRQGLTIDAGKDAGTAVADKALKIASTARETLAQSPKSPRPTIVSDDDTRHGRG
jgi:hypothetical protein